MTYGSLLLLVCGISHAVAMLARRELAGLLLDWELRHAPRRDEAHLSHLVGIRHALLLVLLDVTAGVGALSRVSAQRRVSRVGIYRRIVRKLLLLHRLRMGVDVYRHRMTNAVHRLLRLPAVAQLAVRWSRHHHCLLLGRVPISLKYRHALGRDHRRVVPVLVADIAAVPDE